MSGFISKKPCETLLLFMERIANDKIPQNVPQELQQARKFLDCYSRRETVPTDILKLFNAAAGKLLLSFKTEKPTKIFAYASFGSGGIEGPVMDYIRSINPLYTFETERKLQDEKVDYHDLVLVSGIRAIRDNEDQFLKELADAPDIRTLVLLPIKDDADQEYIDQIRSSLVNIAVTFVTIRTQSSSVEEFIHELQQKDARHFLETWLEDRLEEDE